MIKKKLRQIGITKVEPIEKIIIGDKDSLDLRNNHNNSSQAILEQSIIDDYGIQNKLITSGLNKNINSEDQNISKK